MNLFPDVEIFVLAGGKSSRMGRDKGLVLLNGKPMVSYVLETFQDIKLPIKIIANDPAYKSFGYPVFTDVVKEKGPMGGLLTAMENTAADVIFLVSCDMPFLETAAVKKLLNAADEDDIIAVLVGQKINPLFAIYPVRLKPEVERLIAAEKLKMTDFILKNKHTLVPSGFRDTAGNFRNINTPQELKEAKEQWRNLE